MAKKYKAKSNPVVRIEMSKDRIPERYILHCIYRDDTKELHPTKGYYVEDSLSKKRREATPMTLKECLEGLEAGFGDSDLISIRVIRLPDNSEEMEKLKAEVKEDLNKGIDVCSNRDQLRNAIREFEDIYAEIEDEFTTKQKERVQRKSVSRRTSKRNSRKTAGKKKMAANPRRSRKST